MESGGWTCIDSILRREKFAMLWRNLERNKRFLMAKTSKEIEKME
jgi:hypothetical protein